MKQAKYQVETHFTLPREAWWENYYLPMRSAIAEMLARHPEVEAAQNVATTLRREIEMYEKFGKFYGYEFFVLSPVD